MLQETLETLETPKTLDDFVRRKIGKGLTWVLNKKKFTLNKDLSVILFVTPEKPHASTRVCCILSKGVTIEILGSYSAGFQPLGYTNRFRIQMRGLTIEPDTFHDKRTNVFEAELEDVIKAIS